jgi:hypothetical protein
VGKRIAIISVILLVSCLAITGYFIHQGRKVLFTDPYKAVSHDACIVIETVDLKKFISMVTSGNGLAGEAAKIKGLEDFNSKLKFIGAVLGRPDYAELMTEGHSVISFYPGEAGRLSTMFSIVVPGTVRISDVKKLLVSAGVREASEIKRDKKTILRIVYQSGEVTDTAYISFISGLLLCSNSEKLIEDAGKQVFLENDIRTTPGYSRVWIASGKREDKVFVVFPNLSRFLKSVFGMGGQQLADMTATLAGAAEGDIYLNNDGLVLSGYTETSGPGDRLFADKQVTPKSFHTNKVLPASTVLFETRVLTIEKAAPSDDATGFSETAAFADKIREYTGEEITRALIGTRDSSIKEKMLFIYELTNAGRTEQLFQEELMKTMEISWFRPDDQVKIAVYHTNLDGLAGMISPGFSRGYPETWFAFYDNFMVSGSSYNTVSKFLYDNILHKTLANNQAFLDFERTLASHAGYFFYCVPSKITAYLGGFLNEKLVSFLSDNKSIISKIQAVGYQYASSNGMLYNSLSLKYKENVYEEPDTEWETLLDTVAVIKPFFFTNHITGAKEIFVQDIKNNAYLINSAGRVLWKVPLRERINSTVYIIDYFRNGKLQLLFSGKEYIHLLDRNGNYVERYPVKLRSPASNSLTVFDYDNNHNYRLFIAGEDKMVYSYDKTGNVVKGWAPFRTPGIVASEIMYFNISRKDYIVFSDESSVYLLDRTGKKRVTLKGSAARAHHSSMRLVTVPDPCIIFSSPEGAVTQLFLDGTIRKFSLNSFSVDHSFDYFDVDGDGLGEFIFIDGGKLYLYDNNREELFSRDFGSTELGGPITFIFSSADRKIGVFDINNKLIYLIDKKGETMEGFPLRGASMFSVGKLSDKNDWNLVVGGTDRFLYNYKLEMGAK